MRSTDPGTLRTVDIWTFKSSKSNKRYIVEVEHFNNHFFGLKFYWKGVASSKNRYSLLTNDFEPRTIIMSCIDIMIRYFTHDKCASFGFVAAEDLFKATDKSRPNKRFRFYRRMMLSLFKPETFLQVNDTKKSIYLLVNQIMIKDGAINLKQIEAEISRLYEGEYRLESI